MIIRSLIVLLRPLPFSIVAIAALFAAGPARADTGDIPVRINVHLSDGERAADAYVALVPPQRPWSRPAAEKAESGHGIVLHVPEGEYRVVAGSRHHGLRITDSLTIGVSCKNEVSVKLPRMRALTGVVRNEEGEPLSDVRIGIVEAFVEAPLGRLSELAVSHFGSDWTTRSTDDGKWALRVPEDSVSAIVAEAPGYATAWTTHDGQEPVNLSMRKGAALRLIFNRKAPEYVVTLVRRGDKTSVPSRWEEQIRARRVVDAAIEWSSLAEGEYEIFAQQWDPRAFSEARKLGTVALQQDTKRELRLELPRAQAISNSVSEILVKSTAEFDALTMEAFGRDRNGLPRSMPHVTETVSGGTLLYLDTAGLRPPYYGITSDRFIVLQLGEDDGLAVAVARNLGGASLAIRSPSATLPLPTVGLATFHGCSRPETIRIPVAVSRDGNVSFAAPAHCAGFVLDFEPFSPIVFRQRLSAENPEYLGDVTLAASGSAAVRVARHDGAAVAEAIVSVSTVTVGEQQSSVLVAEERTGPDGWARFERLPAGRELTVAARTSDSHRSVVETIRPEPTSEWIVDPLVIPQPTNLTLEPKLDADFTAVFPDGRIAALILEPLDGGAERRTASVGPAGRAEFEGLLPGRWHLEAIITTGQGSQPIPVEEIELKAGESKLMKPLLKPLIFRGRVSGKESDLSGNIDILSPRRSDPVPSVQVAPSGEFVAILPRRDTYFVGVRLRRTGQMMWVGNTPFLEPSQQVVIELPQGVIVARVSAEGRPLSGAMVMARMQHAHTPDIPLIALPVRADTDGEARIEGLLPGAWVVFVLQDGHAQKSVTVSTTEAVHVDLEVKRGLEITGTVVEASGLPVAGAKVSCLLPGPDGVPYIRLAFTGDDGSFDVEDRVFSRSPVLCSVTSFSGAQGYRVMAGEHALLMLPSDPATLVVNDLPEVDRFSSLWLVSPDGRLIEVSPYVPRVPGAVALYVPALAPEAWKLVRVSSPWDWMGLTTGGGSLPDIVEVRLQADERKTIDLKNAGHE